MGGRANHQLAQGALPEAGSLQPAGGGDPRRLHHPVGERRLLPHSVQRLHIADPVLSERLRCVRHAREGVQTE